MNLSIKLKFYNGKIKNIVCPMQFFNHKLISGRKSIKAGMIIAIFFMVCLVSGGQEKQKLQLRSFNDFGQPPYVSLDTAECFEFRLDLPAAPVSLRIKPDNFKIIKGKSYWIEPTLSMPFAVTAMENGTMNLDFDQVPYQYVSITPTSGNLLKKTIPAKVDKSTGKIIPYAAHFRIEKSPVRGMLKTQIDRVSLIPGKKYRLTYRWRYLSRRNGSYFFVGASVKADGIPAQNMRDTGAYCNRQGWQFGYKIIKIPATWKNPTAEIYVNSDSVPLIAEISHLDLRLAPKPRRNQPRHRGTTTQYARAVSEKKLAARLEKRKAYSARIVRFAERPVLQINGKNVAPVGYQGESPQVAKLFNQTGFSIAWLPVRMGGFYRYRRPNSKKLVWKGKDSYDFSIVDAELKKRLLYTPDQPVILTVGAYPYPGFSDDFPDAAWRTASGDKIEIEAIKNKTFHSITGEIYRREVGKSLCKLGEYLKKSPYGKNVIGIHFCDGGDGQWFNWKHSDWTKIHFDYSPDNQRELRKLLAKRYGNNVSKLRKAWNSPDATFENSTIPKPEEWSKYFYTLLNPEIGSQKRLIDYAQLYEEALVNSINHLAGEFKAGLGRPTICTVYFPHDSTSSLLRAKNIDGIVSVPFYGGHRAVGNANFVEQPAGAFRINNKLLLWEMDHRSDFSNLAARIGGFDRRGLGVPVGPDLLADQLRRDFAASLTQGQYAWILTIAGYNTWANNYFKAMPEYLRAVKLSQLYVPQWYDWGQIAFISDYKAKRNSGRSYGFTYNTNRLPRKSIMSSGASFSDYLVSDVGNNRINRHKVFIFADAINLTAGQVRYIEKNLQKNGNILVFTFATALNTPGGFEKNIKRLSGITVKKDLKRTVLFQYAEKASKDPLAKGFGLIPVETGDKIPLFYIDDPDAKVLAWHQSDSVLAAAAVKRNKNWTGIYLANGYFAPEFPRALVEAAGMMPPGPLGDVTLAGNSIVAIHACSAGMKTLRWKKKVKLIDLENGQMIRFGSNKISFPMKFGETRWLKVIK